MQNTTMGQPSSSLNASRSVTGTCSDAETGRIIVDYKAATFEVTPTTTPPTEPPPPPLPTVVNH
jgi:hypothetical protein